MTLTIRAKSYGDGWLGYVDDGTRELHMTRSYPLAKEALAAADEWREQEEAYRVRTRYGVSVKHEEPWWNGYEQMCPCGQEIWGSSDGVIRCEEGHRWRKTSEGWMKVDGD